jgi:hypothetical protein
VAEAFEITRINKAVEVAKGIKGVKSVMNDTIVKGQQEVGLRPSGSPDIGSGDRGLALQTASSGIAPLHLATGNPLR